MRRLRPAKSGFDEANKQLGVQKLIKLPMFVYSEGFRALFLEKRPGALLRLG